MNPFHALVMVCASLFAASSVISQPTLTQPQLTRPWKTGKIDRVLEQPEISERRKKRSIGSFVDSSIGSSDSSSVNSSVGPSVRSSVNSSVGSSVDSSVGPLVGSTLNNGSLGNVDFLIKSEFNLTEANRIVDHHNYLRLRSE